MINTCADAIIGIPSDAAANAECEEVATIIPAAVETETHYSWFYYERED